MKYKEGFTLLEILIVVIIIGILASIALPQYRKAVAKAELAQIISAVKSIKYAQDRFYLTNSSYADSLDSLDINIDAPNTTCFTNRTIISCYNKNFSLWKRMDINYLECASKTEDENSALSYACKDFMQNYSKGAVQTLCPQCSSCVYLLNQTPCSKWSSTYPSNF